MKKFFTFFAAALMSVSMFGATVQEDIPLDEAAWQWGYSSTTVVNDGILHCTLTGEWGATSTGWGDNRDLSGWDKIIILVENMNGCDGEYWKLKAYLRDNTESEADQMEGSLGLDAPDNEQNYLVIDLHQDKACDLTNARILAIQCQPNGAEFKISRVYLEKEAEVEGELTYLAVNLPTENRPADDQIEIVGTFQFQDGAIDLLKLDNGWFIYKNPENENFPLFYAAADDTFKLRDKTNNDKVLCKLVNDQWVQAILKFGDNWEYEQYGYKGSDPCWWYENDLSDANTYAWMEGMPEPEPEPEEGIENVVLTEKAQKVVVDGVMYIVRDGKMFNVQGAQVR